MPVYHAEGPPTSKISRAQAEATLRRNPNVPKDAEVDIWEHNGHWIAAYHVAGPPFGAPADDEEESPGPKGEGPDDTAPEPSDSEGGEKPDIPGDEEGGDEGEGGPPKEKKEEKGKGGEEHLLHELYDAVQKMMVALGIADSGPEDSPVPGGDEPPAPPGAAGPPTPPPGGPAGGPDQEIKHERALKPGEAPPGTTPVGAPAFSGVYKGHPWEHMIGQVASFSVEEKINDRVSMADVDAELRRVAHGTGFKVKQVTEGRDENGHRTARAMISAY